MIFVTVGTHYQGFERLILKMDEIASRIDEEVVMQIGYTEYEPRNVRWFKFTGVHEINKLYKEADIIVSHAGAGTLIDCLSFGKPLVVVPRLKKFKEHLDDQQIELAEALDKTNKVVAVYEIEELENNLEKIKNHELKPYKKRTDLKNYLENSLKGTSK